ncbi:MAG: alpha/beta hydrolase fold domain-containing protein, partial [Parafannyhessea umbonata]|nr:alpha/beta hydrolase fold domain-containing protein [Parafannyhessea umbonata]
MPSEYAELMNAIFRDRPWDASPEAHAHEGGDGASARRPPRTPKGVTVEKIDLNGLGGEQLTKRGNAGWVLYVHGGGYMAGSARERREVCQYIADMHGRNVMSCNYRLAPEHLWPAQIDDTLAAWEGVLAQGVDAADVIVAGESAGGTLA